MSDTAYTASIVAKNMKVWCPKCQSDIKHNQTFCGRCGKAINYNCRVCETKNNIFSNYCKGCGEPLPTASSSERTKIKNFAKRYVSHIVFTKSWGDVVVNLFLMFIVNPLILFLTIIPLYFLSPKESLLFWKMGMIANWLLIPITITYYFILASKSWKRFF